MSPAPAYVVIPFASRESAERGLGHVMFAGWVVTDEECPELGEHVNALVEDEEAN